MLSSMWVLTSLAIIPNIGVRASNVARTSPVRAHTSNAAANRVQCLRMAQDSDEALAQPAPAAAAAVTSATAPEDPVPVAPTQTDFIQWVQNENYREQWEKENQVSIVDKYKPTVFSLLFLAAGFYAIVSPKAPCWAIDMHSMSPSPSPSRHPCRDSLLAWGTRRPPSRGRPLAEVARSPSRRLPYRSPSSRRSRGNPLESTDRKRVQAVGGA